MRRLWPEMLMLLTGVALLVFAAYLMEAVEFFRFLWAFLGSF